MMAAREVFGFPEDAALRLTPGAGLEVVGMKELEEEGVEEEEEKNYYLETEPPFIFSHRL